MFRRGLLVLFLCVSLFSNVHAESRASGIVQAVSLDKGIIEINNIEYRVEMSKTALISGMHSLDLDLLEVGVLVNYIFEGYLLIELELVKPFEFQS